MLISMQNIRPTTQYLLDPALDLRDRDGAVLEQEAQLCADEMLRWHRLLHAFCVLVSDVNIEDYFAAAVDDGETRPA